ncbi:MAG: tetratricopeptide repeat protein [Leptospiraceae bacterium]|nr:tetratricopeptide repeat protein [Leptospiraceae bacterium]
MNKTVKTIHELSQLVSWLLYRHIEAIRELPLRIIPIILLLTCSTPEEKNSKPSIESVKIKGRIQIDEIKYSGPPKESWIVTGIRDTVTNDLAKVREVEAISIDDQNKALKMIAERRKSGEKNLDPSKESAKILAADYLCVGNLQNTGKVLRLNIRLLKAPDFSAEQTATLDGTLDEIFTLQDKVVESLLANVDAKMTPEERLVIEVFTPKNKKAYEVYVQGLEVMDTNPKKALDLFLEALKLEPDYLDALHWIGNQYFVLSQYEKALEYHNKRKKLLEDKRLSNFIDYADTLDNIGRIYRSQSKYAEALEYFFKAQRISEDLGLGKTAVYAAIINDIGRIYRSQGKYADALDYFIKAQKIREYLGLGKTEAYADILRNIGSVYDSQGKYGDALDYYFKAQKISEDIGFGKTAGYAIGLNNIGKVYESQGKYAEALEYFFKSNKIKENLGLGKTAAYASTINNIGGIYESQGKYADALDYYFKAQKIREYLGLGKTASYAITLNNIGSVYYMKREYCKSAEWAKKAVTIQEEVGVPSNRENLNAAQENCNASKPTSVDQEKKKAIDWIKKNNQWDDPNHNIVNDVTEEINSALQEKKSISIAFGSGLLKSGKAMKIYWKNNRFSMKELSDQEVNEMELGEMSIKTGTLKD